MTGEQIKKEKEINFEYLYQINIDNLTEKILRAQGSLLNNCSEQAMQEYAEICKAMKEAYKQIPNLMIQAIALHKIMTGIEGKNIAEQQITQEHHDKEVNLEGEIYQ